jgi:hypothetical protein
MSDMELVITTTGNRNQAVVKVVRRHNLTSLLVNSLPAAQRALKGYPSEEDWKHQLQTSRAMGSPALNRTPSLAEIWQLPQQLLLVLPMLEARSKVMQQPARVPVALIQRQALPVLSRSPAAAMLKAAACRRGR